MLCVLHEFTPSCIDDVVTILTNWRLEILACGNLPQMTTCHLSTLETTVFFHSMGYTRHTYVSAVSALYDVDLVEELL